MRPAVYGGSGRTAHMTTPELGQLLADVFDAPVTLLESAEEGTAWGAALMARFRREKMDGAVGSWIVAISGVGRRG